MGSSDGTVGATLTLTAQSEPTLTLQGYYCEDPTDPNPKSKTWAVYSFDDYADPYIYYVVHNPAYNKDGGQDHPPWVVPSLKLGAALIRDHASIAVEKKAFVWTSAKVIPSDGKTPTNTGFNTFIETISQATGTRTLVLTSTRKL